MDYEREGRAPMELTEYAWQADDPIADKFGYVEGLKLSSPGSIITHLVENTSKNGNLLLNISPKADGTIPGDQQAVLLEVGKWLDINGEAIYGTRPWTQYGEGPAADAAAKLMTELRGRGFPGRTNQDNCGNDTVGGGGIPRRGYTTEDFRFTTKDDSLYVFIMAWPESRSAPHQGAARGSQTFPRQIKGVQMLGGSDLKFDRRPDGLVVTLPETKPSNLINILKVIAEK